MINLVWEWEGNFLLLDDPSFLWKDAANVMMFQWMHSTDTGNAHTPHRNSVYNLPFCVCGMSFCEIGITVLFWIERITQTRMDKSEANWYQWQNASLSVEWVYFVYQTILRRFWWTSPRLLHSWCISFKQVWVCFWSALCPWRQDREHCILYRKAGTWRKVHMC